jgi:acyl-CoA thioesterase-2
MAVNAALESLVKLLDLEEVEKNIFRGQNEYRGRRGWGRLFGGQVAAQALVAAGRTVEGTDPHSLHGYFLRGGDPEVPVVYTVDRIRDGRSFATRRVVAIQHGEAIFNMSVSFHRQEDGYEHQYDMPDVPKPEELPTWEERAKELEDRIPEGMRGYMTAERPLEMRSDQPYSWFATEPRHDVNTVWMRASGDLGSDPRLHQYLFTYASDMALVDNIYRPHRHDGPRDVMMASLDHAIWFHRPFRLDEWLLYVQESPAAAGARGFARGTVYTRDGVLVASVAQEGLMRRVEGYDAERAPQAREDSEK